MFGKTGSTPDEIGQRFGDRGGGLEAARAEYPGAPEPWIDLSGAISPWQYPFQPLPKEALRGFPDCTALSRLAATAAKAYRAPGAAEIVPLPGVNLGLSILPWLFRTPMRVAILEPAAAAHASAWEAAGHSVSEIESLDRVGGAAILIAVNPSDVNGRFISHADLAAALPPLKRRDGILIVDETFADADDSHSLLPAVARLDYTLVLRSTELFFGGAGLPLGFAITSHPIAERLRTAIGASPVPAQALAFGQAALSDIDWIEAQRIRLKRGADELGEALAAAGLRVLGGTALFKLAACTTPSDLLDSLASQGILVRVFRDRYAVRFGLPGGPDELARLRQALQRN